MYNHEKEKDIVFRILEDRWFHKYWSKESHFPKKVDPSSRDWRLYFELIDEIKNQATEINADLAIFPSTEIGHYQWNRSWYRVNDDPVSKENYFSYLHVIKDHMAKRGIGVIDNTIPYDRARNDPHPNAKGNESMAEDILKYLMLHYKDKLELYNNRT
jgi:hypothetical protein